RLGLRTIRGLSEAAGKRIAARKPYASVHELELNRKDLRCLAAAGALKALAGHRHLAHWSAAGAARRAPLDAPALERLPALAAPTEGQDIVADYASLGLTLGRHPLALLRKRLARLQLIQAQKLHRLPHGSAARVAGLVTGQQRPDTARGVMFVTHEDETGNVNVVVWNNLVERQRTELLGARLLGVQGTIERDGEVVHLVARRLYDYTSMLGPLTVTA